MTAEATTPIKIDVTGWSTISGSRVGLAIDPVERRIYDYYTIGAGTPVHIWHNRHMGLGANIPTSTVPESLAEFLAAESEAVEAIIDGFIESEWDGSNHIGRWTQEARDEAGALSDRISQALSSNEIATYWDAGDYFLDAMSAAGLLDEVGEQTFDEYIEAQVAEGVANGCHLDPDDVRTTLTDAFTDALETYDEEIAEDGESEELTEAQAATARRIL
jgi:hypothetical protein